MRLPNRTPGEFTNIIPDPYLTQAKFDDFKRKFDKLKKVDQPTAIKEMQRLAELGDFSENAAYQMAKGRLRSINSRLDKLNEQLKAAIIIKPTGKNKVEIGHKVTFLLDGQQKIFTILGMAEIDISRHIISHSSPIGSALLGKKIGEIFKTKLGEKEVEIKIISLD